MKVYEVYESESLSHVWLCDPMDYTVYGIFQARILEWVAFPLSRGSSQPRDRTQVSCIAGGFFTSWTIREALNFHRLAHTVDIVLCIYTFLIQHSTLGIFPCCHLVFQSMPIRFALKLFIQMHCSQLAKLHWVPSFANIMVVVYAYD